MIGERIIRLLVVSWDFRQNSVTVAEHDPRENAISYVLNAPPPTVVPPVWADHDVGAGSGEGLQPREPVSKAPYPDGPPF